MSSPLHLVTFRRQVSNPDGARDRAGREEFSNEQSSKHDRVYQAGLELGPSYYHYL